MPDELDEVKAAVEREKVRAAVLREKARTAGAPAPAAQLSALREPDPETIDYNALPATSPQQSTLGSPGAAGQGWHGITDAEAAAGERSYMGQMWRQATSPFTTAGESIQQAKNVEGTVDPALTAGIHTAGSIAFAPAAIATAPLAPVLNWVGEKLDPIARGAAWVAKGMPEGKSHLRPGEQDVMPGEGYRGVQSVRALVNLGSQYLAAKGAGAAIGALRGSPIGEAVKSEFKSVLPTYGRETAPQRAIGNPVQERAAAANAENLRRIGQAVDTKYGGATLKPQDVKVPEAAKAEMPKPPVPIVASATPPAAPEKPAPTPPSRAGGAIPADRIRALYDKGDLSPPQIAEKLGVDPSVVERVLFSEEPAPSPAKPRTVIRNEAGEPVTVYHGTSVDFEAFDPAKRGSNTRAASAKRGFFFAEDPETAANYLPQIQKGSFPDAIRTTKLPSIGISLPDYDLSPMVRDTHARFIAQAEKWQKAGVKLFPEQEAKLAKARAIVAKADAFYKDHPEIPAGWDPSVKTVREGATVRRSQLSMENPLVYDMKSKGYRPETYYDIIQRAIRNGNDGVIIKNTFDGGPKDNIYVVFDPAQEVNLARVPVGGERIENVPKRVLSRPAKPAEAPPSPPPASGQAPAATVRLYRAEPIPGTGKGKPSWVAEAHKASGQADAEGRWFTNDPKELEFYQRDNPGGRTTYIDVPAADLEQYRVQNLPADHPARRFSRVQDKEFFVSPELAAKRQVLPAAPSAPDVPAAPPRTPDPSGGGAAVPPRGPTIGAGAPPAETPPGGPTLGAQSPRAPLTPGDNRGAIRTQLSEKIDNLKGFSPDLFYKVKEALSLKSARTAKPVRDLQQALKNLTPEEAQGLTPAIMERRAQGTPAQNAFAEWWQNEHPKIREHLKSVGSRVVEKRDLADLPETIPPDWNLKEIGPGKYLVTRPINAVPDFFPMRMSEVAREALKAGDPVVTEAIYGEGLKQGAWKDKAGFDQYLETYEAPNLKSTAAGLERPRKFRVPDEYREPDVVKTLNRYMHDVGQTSSEQSVFRYFDEKTGEARNPNETWAPQGDLGDILGRLDPTERHAAERLSLDLLGRNPEGWAEQNRKSIEFSNRVGAVNALRLYGIRPTTALVQLTQSAMTNSLVGTKATAKAVARFVMNPRAVYEEAIRSGAVRPHSQYADTIGVREQGAKGGVLNAASDLAMKPMAMTDLAGRLVASATAPDFAAQIGKQLQGNVWSKRIALKKLEALDYAPADAPQFVNGLTPEQMDVLRQRIVERTQGEVTNASRIPAATTPVGRVIMQGKNFGIAQARNTWRVAGKQLFQAGNPIPAAKLVVGAYLAGKGIAAAKDFLVGPSEKTRPDDALTALHEGSLGGYVGDLAYAGIRGKQDFDAALSRVTDSQFAGLLEAVAKAAYDVNDPPTARKIATGQGPPIDIKKSRADVLIEALQNAAPTGKEWVRIYNHFVGDDSIRKHEANAKALRELRKAQQGATLGAGAR